MSLSEFVCEYDIHIQILKTDFHIQRELVLDHFALVVALLIHMPFLLIMYRSC